MRQPLETGLTGSLARSASQPVERFDDALNTEHMATARLAGRRAVSAIDNRQSCRQERELT